MTRYKTNEVKWVVLVVCCFLATGLTCFGQRQAVEKGAMDSLNAQREMNDRLFRELISGDEGDRDKVITNIKAKPSRVIPPVLYAMAQTLYQKGRKKEAAYWYVVAQLRARIDVNLIKDDLKHYGKNLISLYEEELGRSLKPFILKNAYRLDDTIHRAIQTVQTRRVTYDPRWVFAESRLDHVQEKTLKSLLKPKRQWRVLTTETIDYYQHAFIWKLYGKRPE